LWVLSSITVSAPIEDLLNLGQRAAIAFGDSPHAFAPNAGLNDLLAVEDDFVAHFEMIARSRARRSRS
jgi:hypothetical protein